MANEGTSKQYSPIVWATAVVIVVLFSAVAYRVVIQCETSSFELLKQIRVDLGGCKPSDVDKSEAEVTPKFTAYFEFDRSRPNSVSMGTIEDAYFWFYQHPGKKIVVEGHAATEEAVPPAESDLEEPVAPVTLAYGQKLSERRANAVRDLLVSRGITPTRIEAVGFGTSLPVATGTAVSDGKNRRVDIVILDENEEYVLPREARTQSAR